MPLDNSQIERIRNIHSKWREHFWPIFIDRYKAHERKDLIKELDEERYKFTDLLVAIDLLGASRAFMQDRKEIYKEDIFLAGGILCILPWWPKHEIDKVYLKELKRNYTVGIMDNFEGQNRFLGIIKLDILKESFIDIMLAIDLRKISPSNFFTFELKFEFR